MAKTGKIKKRDITVHSRAARRAVSPSDPALKKALDADAASTTKRTSVSPPPNPASKKPHVLAAQNATPIKKTKSRPVKRAQRLRQQKGMEKADQNMDKLELKREKSFGREKKVKERAKGWEDINEVKRKKAKREKEELDEVERKKGLEWVSDEEMDEDVVDGVPVEASGEVKQVEVVEPVSVPLTAASEVDEYL